MLLPGFRNHFPGQVQPTEPWTAHLEVKFTPRQGDVGMRKSAPKEDAVFREGHSPLQLCLTLRKYLEREEDGGLGSTADLSPGFESRE